MTKTKTKKMFQVFLVLAVFLLNSTVLSIISVSAENVVPVIKEFYTGSGKTDLENGYKIHTKANANAMNLANASTTITAFKDYDATSVGGDSGTLYAKVNVGTLHQDVINGWGKAYGFFGSYIYDPAKVTTFENMNVVNCNSYKTTGYVTLDIKLNPFSADAQEVVDLSQYYIALGYDVGWQGAVNNTQYNCVPLSQYYTQADIGKFTRIYIPLSEFNNTANTGLKGLKITSSAWEAAPLSFDYTRVCQLGVVCYDDKTVSLNRVNNKYNNLYFDNMMISAGCPNYLKTSFSKDGVSTDVMQAGAIYVESNIAYSEGVWIVARYSSANELLEIAALDPVNATSQITKNVTVNCDSTDKIKVFLWDGLVNIKPLAYYSQLPKN